MKNILYKIYVKNLAEIIEKFPESNVKEVYKTYNMLLLKDNQFTAVAANGKFYLITLKK